MKRSIPTLVSIPALHLALGRISWPRFDFNSRYGFEIRRRGQADWQRSGEHVVFTVPAAAWTPGL